MSGIITVKSFTGYQVNEVLLAKVCEAIKQGEVDARRYSEIKTFEIYYEGFRSRMVLGRIMVIPAKLADSLEDFPTALLYGAIVNEINPEQVSDLYTAKLGESEFDEYDKKSLAAIKDKLFLDSEGRYRSIVVFIPTWANVRDYVIFKYTRDPERLLAMVRHQIYGAYFNPALSSAFDNLADATDNLNVSDITPKINYPGLVEGQEQSYPDLFAGDSGVKVASSRKPRVLLAKETVNEINEEFLEPGEKAVIDNLSEELKGKINGEIEAPIEVAKVAAEDSATGLRSQPDYGEEGSYTADSNVAAEAEPKTAAAEHTCTDKGRGKTGICTICGKEIVKVASFDNYFDQKEAPKFSLDESRKAEWEQRYAGLPIDQLKHAEVTLVTHLNQNLGKVVHPQNKWRVDQSIAELQYVRELIQQKSAPKQAAVPRIAAVVLKCEGSKLAQLDNIITATAKSGHVETLRIQGSKIKWQRPTQFTLAFRAAAETYVRNPRNGATKTADVPLTFDNIWADIAEDMGPAPVVELKSEPTIEKADPKTESQPSPTPKAPESPSTEPKQEAPSKMDKLREMRDPEGKEESLKDKPKVSAFDMFIPGQAIKEFYPELLRETIEYPNDSFNAQTVSAPDVAEQGSPLVSTNPVPAMGLGNAGKPQILEGAPLRSENDIRGYQFDQEFYAQAEGLSPKAFTAKQASSSTAKSAIAFISKRATTEEFLAQFSKFLKLAMGEIAVTFIAAFKATSRPLMSKVPGTGKIKLDAAEHNATFGMGPQLDVASRVAYLMAKLTDSQIQDAINGAYASCSVWNEDPNGGYNYEVFVRPSAIDKKTLTLQYDFVVGTKGL